MKWSWRYCVFLWRLREYGFEDGPGTARLAVLFARAAFRLTGIRGVVGPRVPVVGLSIRSL